MDMEPMLTGGETFDFSSQLHRARVRLATTQIKVYDKGAAEISINVCTLNGVRFIYFLYQGHTHTTGLSKPDGAQDLRLKVSRTQGTLVNNPSCINTNVHRALQLFK